MINERATCRFSGAEGPAFAFRNRTRNCFVSGHDFSRAATTPPPQQKINQRDEVAQTRQSPLPPTHSDRDEQGTDSAFLKGQTRGRINKWATWHERVFSPAADYDDRAGAPLNPVIRSCAPFIAASSR
jgi:hypothetical protein